MFTPNIVVGLFRRFQVEVLWVVMPCIVVIGYNTVSQPRRAGPQISQPWKPHILYSGVLGLSRGMEPAYPELFCDFSQSFQANVGMVLKMRPLTPTHTHSSFTVTLPLGTT